MPDEGTEAAETDKRSRTRTVEREEINVETVEEQELLCPVCDQWYEEEEIVPVDAEADGDGTKVNHRRYHEEDQVCEPCAESLFGYDGPAGIGDFLAAEWDAIDYRDALSGALSVAVVLGSAGFLLRGFAVLVANFPSEGTVTDTSEAASDPTVGGPIVDAISMMPDLLIPVLLLIVTIHIASAVGPRRMI